LTANDLNPEVTKFVLALFTTHIQTKLDEGSWREVKLLLRFFACLQSLFEGDGVFPVLDELFNRAADQQTASQEDTVGLELVKIILLTIPYIFSYPSDGAQEKAKELLEKTEIIASVQHPLENLAEPYHGDDAGKPFGYQSALELLQRQLTQESNDGWNFSCIPRPYAQVKKDDNGDATMADVDAQAKNKHQYPAMIIPSPVNPGPSPFFPETYFTLYSDQEVETVPREDKIAASLIRDALVDTVNIMDFNRVAVAKLLIDVDYYFASGTFVGRALPFDKIKDIPEGKTTWKPEDVAVDALFSQLLVLPTPEHKLIYFHSVITEACKVAPAAIAPTLGRGIRFVYRHIDWMDLELCHRFLDWFTHHLSNFDFRWKWQEWYEKSDTI
jgi:nuclear cap-binding protein subunit 1